jgi:hypothetical protein
MLQEKVIRIILGAKPQNSLRELFKRFKSYLFHVNSYIGYNIKIN